MTFSRVWSPVALAAGLSLLVGCTTGPTGEVRLPGEELRLVAFDSCDQLGRELRNAAVAQVGPYGLRGAIPLAGADGAVADDGPAARAGAAESGRAPDAGAGAGPGHSGTNVHEAGVDEPDIVKTDGTRIVTVVDGVLRVIDVADRVETGRLDLRDRAGDPGGDGPPADVAGYRRPADLLLHGDRALVLFGSARWGGTPAPATAPAEPADDRAEPGPAGGPAEGADDRAEPAGGPAEHAEGADDRAEPEPAGGPAEPAGDRASPPAGDTGADEVPVAGPRLLLVDLADDPRVVGTYTVDGALVDARAVDGTVRVVVRSAPRLSFPVPAGDGDSPVTDERRTEANREVVESADVAAWLPRYRVTGPDGTRSGRVECDAVSRPAGFSGTSMLTMLTFDLTAAGPGDGRPVSVVADGETVYSNGTSLYVAADQRWRAPVDRAAPAGRTDLYKFDLVGSEPPRYTAAGSVPGWLVNQYALSEWRSHLRVATTSGRVDGDRPDTESAVYVLAERDGALREVGSVGGLGPTERIHSVRFLGPVGYVVTFRETDPLYTVDLADPASPRVLGELKITGYSAHLQPVGEGRLIGVGQEADPDGRRQGTQVSLFDVADPARPSLLDTHHVPGGRSQAEHDPHALLWWPTDRTLVLPVTRLPDGRSAGPPDSGALVLRVGDGEVTERGRIVHPRSDTDQGNGIRRSLVTGDTLWTVSDLGLRATVLSTLEDVAWIPFD